jgi:tetratricopeptide (TPR) repeat protein
LLDAKERVMNRKANRLLLVSATLFGLLAANPVLAAGGGGGGGGGMSAGASAPAYDPVVDYQQGTAALAAKNYALAVRHLRKVVAAAPKEAAAQYMLGASYMGLGDFKKAAKPLEMAVKYNGRMIEARRDLAITHARLGQVDKAAPQLTELKAMLAGCAATCADAAKLTAAVAEVEAALATGKQARGPVDPAIRFADARTADTAYVGAVALINERRFDDAIMLLDQARWAAGPHPDILTYLGFAHRKLQRHDAAEGYYRAALAIAPEHRGALEYYGELKLERGNVAGAKAHLAKLEAICGFGCNEADELRRLIATAAIAEKAPSAS